MNRVVSGILILAVVALTFGCAGMSPTEQRVLSGGALGAGAGAAIGAATGNNPGAGAAIGGAAGAVGGALVDQADRARGYQGPPPGYREYQGPPPGYSDEYRSRDYDRYRSYDQDQYYNRY